MKQINYSMHLEAHLGLLEGKLRNFFRVRQLRKAIKAHKTVQNPIGMSSTELRDRKLSIEMAHKQADRDVLREYSDYLLENGHIGSASVAEEAVERFKAQ